MFYCARSKLYQFTKQFTIVPKFFFIIFIAHSSVPCLTWRPQLSLLPKLQHTVQDPCKSKIAYKICINRKSITEEICPL